MLKIRKAIKNLDGKVFDSASLRRKLEGVRAKHAEEVPDNFGAADLLDMACKEGLAIVGLDGKIRIKL